MKKKLFVLLVVGLGSTHGSFATTVPVTVSPGGAEALAPVESRCPTFSWSATSGAKGYELVVYRIGEHGEPQEAVLKELFQGAVTGWTPSLDQCLQRGERYAWTPVIDVRE